VIPQRRSLPLVSTPSPSPSTHDVSDRCASHRRPGPIAHQT